MDELKEKNSIKSIKMNDISINNWNYIRNSSRIYLYSYFCIRKVGISNTSSDPL
jgi:hypothetical protein